MNLYLNFAAYLGLGLLLLTAGVGLFVLATPKIKEFELIGKRNITAALSLGGWDLPSCLVQLLNIRYPSSIWRFGAPLGFLRKSLYSLSLR